VVELVGFVGTVLGILGTFWVALTAHLTFFGSPVHITHEQVRLYWLSVVVFSVSGASALAAAIYRRARFTPWLHTLLIGIGVAVAIVSSVTKVRPLN
jgi:cation transport ATPase